MPDDVETVAPSDEYLLRRLQTMDPEAFEHFVADVWTYLGWHTRVVGEPGDRGIDVVATDGDRTLLIQAKRYGPNTTVGSPDVQQYAALRLQEDDVDHVTVVTTGSFSQQAREMAPDLDVILVDGERLLETIDEYDAWELFAEWFDEIDQSDGDADPDGLLDRLRDAVGL